VDLEVPLDPRAAQKSTPLRSFTGMPTKRKRTGCLLPAEKFIKKSNPGRKKKKEDLR